MQLDALARRTLFGTTLPSYQLQKFLMKQPEHRATKTEVRKVFSDLSKGSFLSMLIQAKTKEIIIENGEYIELNVDKYSAKTTAGDVIWRDIRMLKVFKRKDIELDTGFSNETVRWYIRKFLQQGLIVSNTEKKGVERTYTLISNEVLRPVPKTKRKKGVADRVFKVAKNLQRFTQSSLMAALKKRRITVSEPYVRQLIYQWKQNGNIEEAFARSNRNQEITYQFIEGTKRPAIAKYKGGNQDDR